MNKEPAKPATSDGRSGSPALRTTPSKGSFWRERAGMLLGNGFCVSDGRDAGDEE